MTLRLLLGVAFVANILVLVICNESAQASATSASSDSATSSSSYASSNSSAVVKSKPVKCRRVKKCPKNEEFSTCPESIQKAQYCSEKAEPSTYRSTAGKPCEEGCVCKENYLRAENGTCLPEDQCPITCGTNEVLDNCPTDCQSDYCPTEEDTEAKMCVMPDVCPPPVCKCSFNHRRACDGSCIPTKDCPPFACRTNEEYNPCPPLCPTDDCSQASPSGECPPQFGHIGIVLPCNPKCRCIKDYWRLDGICVPYGQCPGVCPDNERYSTCVQAECRALNCTQKDQSVPCIRMDPTFCEKGCVCEEGYLRNNDGICVLEDKCEPGVCPNNERYSTCVQAECRALNCTQKDQSIRCIRIDPTFCEKGCVCEEGYLRNNDGICVLEDKCEPAVCPDNERYSTCVQAECRALNCTQKDQSVPCIRMDPTFCEKGCVCEEGYLRNKDGICVLEDKCEPGVCPDNERYSTCVQAECRALNCTQKDQSVPCIRMDPTFCEKGCVCEEGYLRNKDGICVLEDKCEPSPSCTSANEEFVLCMQGVCRAKDCSQKGGDVPCPDIPAEECDSGCICKEHFLRAGNGTCVPEDQCENYKCPLYEVWDDCANAACRAENCTQKGLPVPCPSVTECVPGCLCRPGYLRNANGFCVPEEDCNTHFCPVNEEWSTCAQATCRAQNCSEKGETTICPLIAEGYCEEACVCQENYLRNEKGDCVPEDECPPKNCGENEVLDNCSLTCNSDNCPQSADEEQVCTQSDPCVPACKCVFNYKRAENGTCIPTKDCPPFNCSAKPNEEYVACPPFCPTDECGKPRLEGRCPFIIGTFLQCNPKCQCMDGYGRVNGTCVPFEECPDLCPANEVYSPCVEQTCRPQNCSDRDVAIKTCPTSDAASCQRGCVCQENYYRNNTGVCVSYEECGAPKTCGENEVLDDCPMKCNSDNCPKSADEEHVCTQSDPCVPACKCRFNYKRAENGTCVPTRNCPSFDCSAKPNEEFVACPPICPTDECGKPRLEGRCPFRIGIILECNPKCQCMDGYGRVNGTCVPFEECPDLCPANEVYSPCVQQTCRPQNCSDRDVAIKTCPTSDAASCQRGCVCQENYYRNNTGVCVSYEECGAPKTCGENEVLDDCPMKCNSDNCPKSADEEHVCTQSDPCVPACKCRFNYKRAENGTCVPTRNCPSFDCSAKPNEEFVACPPICPTDECGKPRLEGRCPFRIGIILECNPKCQCMDGYGRVNGTCVSFEECPDLCPANEVYSPCVQQTCRSQNCSDRDVAMKTCPTSDAASCQRGCVCRENYYRNDKGVCVSYEECGVPKTCGENEVLDDCPMKCNSDNCPKSADEEHVCTQSDPCVPACKCRFNYKRAENGTCVPTRNCPSFDCSAKPNEEFVACPPICPTDECGKPRLEGRCPFRIGIILECNPKCQCMDGYGRVNGTCVPFEECPDLCPANEVYSPCVQQTCRSQNCSDRDVAMKTCPTSDAASCQRGCVCQENYYRNDKGVCVSYEECGAGVCPDNERYSTCVQAECRALNCTQKDQSVPCIRMDPTFCEKGCVCEEGYLRNKDGICVLEDKCEPHFCPVNEEWSTCAQATCRAQNCSEKGETTICPLIAEGYCEEACVCQENYLRNEKGDCVPEDECPPKTCGENEVLDNCSLTCNSDNCPQSADEEQVCTQSDPCVPACKCVFNYKRAENGTCIPTKDCPPFNCSAKPNEEYVACPPFCPTDECGKPRLEGRCPFRIGTFLQCNPKCQCMDGYGRVNGTCVPFEECPDLCPANEVYSPCVQQTCRPQNCSDRDVAMETCPTSDTASCQRGCVCQENYYRNDTGVCISYEECGGPMCPNEHEKYTTNFKECPSNTCQSLVVRQPCDENQKEGPGCICESGYLRINVTSPCIPICDCPEMKYSPDC